MNVQYAFPGYNSDGMELRDYFAAKVLQAILTSGDYVWPKQEGMSFEQLDAQYAYLYADAMLAERAKEQKP